MNFETKTIKKGKIMKKTHIGEKIKQERGDIKQTALKPEDKNFQGKLSQIERGKIKNPKKHTLMDIVKGLNDMGNSITFEELIEGTTWEESKEDDSITEVALSPSLLDMRLTDEGVLSINQRSYSLYNKDGQLNKYCPETGEKLIYKCDECGRKVDNAEQKFCMGCGKAYFEEIVIPNEVQEVINDPLNFIDVGNSLGAADHLANYLEDFIRYVNRKMKDEDLKKPTQRAMHSRQIVEFVMNYFKKKFIDVESQSETKVTTDESIKTELFKQAAIRITEKMDTDEFSLEKLLNFTKALGKADDVIELVEQLDFSKPKDEKNSGGGKPEDMSDEKSDVAINDAKENKNKNKGDKNV